MTEKEFVEACKQGGFCCKREAREYAAEHPKSIYTTDDLENAYRSVEYLDVPKNPNLIELGDGARTTAFGFD